MSGPWPNDDFEHRIPLHGRDVTVVVTNTFASVEPGEPPYQYFNSHLGTLWWTWTAPANGMLLIEEVRADSFNDYGLAHAYLGNSVSNLMERPTFENDAFEDRSAFRVAAGETLQLAMSTGFAGTNVVFRLRFLADLEPERLTLIPMTGNQLSLAFRGIPGKTVILERSYDLNYWYESQTITVPEDGIVYAPAGMGYSQGACFYRLRSQP